MWGVTYSNEWRKTIEQPTISITAMETLRDGMVNYEITLSVPGQKPLDLRLSVRGNGVSVETMESVRLSDEMYGKLI